jgi:hypothetical protein
VEVLTKSSQLFADFDSHVATCAQMADLGCCGLGKISRLSLFGLAPVIRSRLAAGLGGPPRKQRPTDLLSHAS